MEQQPDIHLVPTERVSFSQRVAIMNAAYADYLIPIHVTNDQMAQMDQLYDTDSRRSVVARTQWESVGMALLSLRGDRAWVSGVGVVPAWRRHGVARAMMEHLIAQAREAQAGTVRLEVIGDNTPARHLYGQLGFREARELLTWQRSADADPLPIPMERLIVAPPRRLLDSFDAWHEQPPCWQREATTLYRVVDRLRGYRLDWKGEAAAYCLVSEAGGTISLMDVAVNPSAGLLVPGRLLLQALSAIYFGRTMSIMNVPADDTLSRVLAALGFLVVLRQIEMVLDLNAA